ncbi:MAG: hypothetical protein AB7L36_14820, partial [Sphingomonadaceae bacterium]
MHPASLLAFVFTASTVGAARAMAREGAILSAQAIDAVTGAPIATAALVLERKGDEEPVAVATSNSEGYVTVGGLAP